MKQLNSNNIANIFFLILLITACSSNHSNREIGKEITLELKPGLENPRNSEGDFILLKDGRILFIYTHFTSGSGDHASAHLAGRYSDDKGKTWSKTDEIILPNEGGMNIMSVSLLRLQNGNIALFYLKKNSETDCIPYMRISYDEAKTWGKPNMCIDAEGYHVVNNDRIIQLKNGRLMLPTSLHGRINSRLDSRGIIYCYYSDDNGINWARSSKVPNNGNVVLQEPGIIELKDGKVFLFCRTDAGRQYITFSNDMGQTWSPVEASNIKSPLSPASIERIPSTGDLLLVWNNNFIPLGDGKKRTPFNLAISRDEGISWNNIKTIENDSTGWYCYTAIEFTEKHILLGHCAGDRLNGNGLETTHITRLSLDWIYQNEKPGDSEITKGTKANFPDPVLNTESSLMLEGEWMPADPHKIDFENLPQINSQHAVVSNVVASNGVNQHNYLVYFEGKYRAMWSDGPGVEDRAGQRVAFATSKDGLEWSDRKYITPYPPNSGPDSPHYNNRSENAFRYISRGFWKRGKELIALVSLDEADKFFGTSLELRAFLLNSQNNSWEDIGLVYDNAINNFPPKLMPNGEWMMSRRTHDRNVFMLTGGVEGFSNWDAHPVVNYRDTNLKAEEPYWWVLPDGNLLALFRDNARSGFLFRAFSTNFGRTWSKPVQTNFPDARSKFNGLQLSDGRYILVSNPNPDKRDPLALSISDDGIVFNKMGYLIGGRWVDYPHIIEQDGYLLVAFSGKKQSVEVLKIKISDLDKIKMPSEPLTSK